MTSCLWAVVTTLCACSGPGRRIYTGRRIPLPCNIKHSRSIRACTAARLDETPLPDPRRSLVGRPSTPSCHATCLLHKPTTFSLDGSKCDAPTCKSIASLHRMM